MQTVHPSAETVRLVMSRIERAMADSGGNGEAPMDWGIVHRHDCRTVACHGGWYALGRLIDHPALRWRHDETFYCDPGETMMALRPNGQLTHVMYYEGAHMLARDLGFMNAPALKGWAERHPHIWGNRHGERMFAGDGAVAFGRPPFTPVMVSEIVAWWRAVADRLDAAIPVHADRPAALDCPSVARSRGAAGHRGRALHGRLPARPPAPPGKPAVASALIAFVGGAARTVIPRRTAAAPRPCPRRRQEAEQGRGPGGADGPAGAVSDPASVHFHTPSREVRMNFIAPGAEPLIREIPLSRLALAPENVRKTPPDAQADAELKASIAAIGLLENLVVRAEEPTEDGDRYAVVAGGRRLRAMQALAADGVLDADRPVPCQIRSGDVEPAELSLAENVVRIAMHPADQVVAFSKLVQAGQPVSSIAARFGVSERHGRAAAAPRQRRARAAGRLPGRTRSIWRC